MSLDSGELGVVSAVDGAKSADNEAFHDADHLTDLFQAAEPADQGESGPVRTTSGKLFIGGLSWETTEGTLAAHFGKFGELTDVVVMKNRANGQPRGFGFVTFKDPSVARAILSDVHTLDGRNVEVKAAVPKEDCPPKNVGSMSSPLGLGKDSASAHGVMSGLPMSAIPILQLPAFLGPDTGATLPDPRKVFVGGLASSVDDDRLRDYFESLGVGGVAEAIVMMDKDTLRSRGFGFVTFIDEASVDRVLVLPHSIDGKAVEVKRAKPKGDASMKDAQGHIGGYAMMHGAPRAEMAAFPAMPVFRYDAPHMSCPSAPSPRVQYTPRGSQGTSTPMGSSPGAVQLPQSNASVGSSYSRASSSGYPSQRQQSGGYYAVAAPEMGYYVAQAPGTEGVASAGYPQQGAVMYTIDPYGRPQPIAVSAVPAYRGQSAGGGTAAPMYSAGYMFQSPTGAPMYFAAPPAAMPMYYPTMMPYSTSYPPPPHPASGTPKATPPVHTPSHAATPHGARPPGASSARHATSAGMRGVAGKAVSPQPPIGSSASRTPLITPKTMHPTPSSGSLAHDDE